ncbi:MAG TPA: hypothetical protein VH188_05795 [Chthoniobacterales bacterium]|jgi:hypothetical protein|nr:hypothetical protein [Chthoniobacterales bacterium]
MKLRLSPRALVAIAALSCAIFFSGCAVSFVAPYDETTDHLLTDLSQKTETAVVRADAGQLSAEDREKFYSDSLGTVRMLKARSTLFAKNEDETSALGTLEENYDALSKRGAPPRSSLTIGLRRSLLALQQIQIAKKRSSIFSAGLKKTSSSP